MLRCCSECTIGLAAVATVPLADTGRRRRRFMRLLQVGDCHGGNDEKIAPMMRGMGCRCGGRQRQNIMVVRVNINEISMRSSGRCSVRLAQRLARTL